MTDKVFPSTLSPIDRFNLPGIVQWAGSDDYGWVVPTGTLKLAAAARLAFAQASGGGSLNVTIDTGEGFVGGSWIDRDAQTVVALAANVAGQIVYAGWDRDLRDVAIVGLAAAFEAEDAKMPIWSFTTNGAGVTAVTDLREQVSPYQRVITDAQHGERTGPANAHEVADITGASAVGHTHAASSVVGASINDSMTTGTRYDGPYAGTLVAAENEVSLLMPRAGTARNFRIRTTSAQGGDGNLVLTIRKNEADTTITVTIAAGAGAGVYSDLANSVAYAAGDRLALKLVSSATSPAALGSWSLEFDV